MTSFRFRPFTFALLLVPACSPKIQTASIRNPDLFEKESDHFVGRGAGPSEPAPELYVRRPGIAITKKDRPNETGSLYNPEDERNWLFTSTGPLNVGRFLTIKLASNRQDPAAKGKDPKAAVAAEEKKGDAIEAELLKAIPDLAPAVPGETSLLKAFKMKIVHRYDNGDVLAMTERNSRVGETETDVHAIQVKARIPYDRLASGDPLTTEDLLAVKFIESQDGELADRDSSGWEDEYSLRLSGYTEAKSKVAMEIDDKRRQLDDAKGKLENQVKSFSKERETVAKTREDLAKRKTAQEEKLRTVTDELSETKDDLKDKEETIKEQEEQIKELEEKPGDKKDGT